MADRFFPGQDPLDQAVQILGPRPRRIVGVVQNIRHRGLDGALDPEVYVPHPQSPLGGMFLAVRARSGDPARLAGAVRAEVRALDRNLPISSVRTSQDLLDDTLSRRRFSLVLLTIFASTALALSIVGVYGVLSFAIAQRTREIGIRMALGAASRDVLRLTLLQGMRPVLAGLAIGQPAPSQWRACSPECSTRSSRPIRRRLPAWWSCCLAPRSRRHSFLRGGRRTSIRW